MHAFAGEHWTASCSCRPNDRSCEVRSEIVDCCCAALPCAHCVFYSSAIWGHVREFPSFISRSVACPLSRFIVTMFVFSGTMPLDDSTCVCRRVCCGASRGTRHVVASMLRAGAQSSASAVATVQFVSNWSQLSPSQSSAHLSENVQLPSGGRRSKAAHPAKRARASCAACALALANCRAALHEHALLITPGTRLSRRSAALATTCATVASGGTLRARARRLSRAALPPSPPPLPLSSKAPASPAAANGVRACAVLGPVPALAEPHVPRPALAAALTEALGAVGDTSASKVLLHGAAGTGKSQAACAWVRERRNAAFATVVWLDLSDTAALDRSCARVAEQAGLLPLLPPTAAALRQRSVALAETAPSAPTTPHATAAPTARCGDDEAVDAVLQWLWQRAAAPWLLVLEHAEPPSIAPPPPADDAAGAAGGGGGKGDQRLARLRSWLHQCAVAAGSGDGDGGGGVWAPAALPARCALLATSRCASAEAWPHFRSIEVRA